MKIEVTREDIEDGVQGSPCWCPLAIAARRVFTTGKIEVVVGLSQVWVYALPCIMVKHTSDYGHEKFFAIRQEPGEALSKIKRYDENGVMEPFSVELFKIRVKAMRGFTQRTPREEPQQIQKRAAS